MAASDEIQAVLMGLVDRARDDIYATENERLACPGCDKMTRSYRQVRLAELDAAAEWLGASGSREGSDG